ncbi:F-box protein SKIP23 [Carex littledalei]|uniref:F-box protein SKIP23 n=1 Tax=Carex littledalei TaxID=544730 RepID=A0A833QKF6_9POAL|nr:F-box protein SKIP23 [Carex littledalei]
MATELSPPFELQGTNQVDWSDLPSDLLQTISKRLHDIFDFTYFRAVCKKWRVATSISDLPPQIPWLLEERNNVKNSGSENLRFYSLFSDKIRSIHCPPSRGKYLFGPSHGYLYAANLDSDYPTYSLLNPLTNDEMIINFERHFHSFLVCMGPDPMGCSDDHMAFSFLGDGLPETIGFYQPRNWEWDYVQVPHLISNSGHACFKGIYYMNEAGTGNTLVVNIAGASSISVPPPETLYSSDSVYFVESAGKILRVVQKLDLDFAVSNSNISFDIYQLDVGAENHEYRWVKTSSISNQILFLDWRNGISITANETTKLMGNCIYYLKSHFDGLLRLSCDVYKYNIEDGLTEKVPLPCKKGDSWFVPRV